MKRVIARVLRRLAQRLSPIPTSAQVREVRDYYDNHDSITGAPILRHQVNVHGTLPPTSLLPWI